MKVIAEIGSCWLPKKFPLRDAVDAALDCGADLVKIQFWSTGAMLAMRRGGAAGLEQWALGADEVLALAYSLRTKHKRPVLGASVFYPNDVTDLGDAVWNLGHMPLAFIKTATQEFQYADLARAVSAFSAQSQVPLYVSVPRDGCLVMGNYSSPLPISWLYCEPNYPAAFTQYGHDRIPIMRQRLPGNAGLSDHTADSELLRRLMQYGGDQQPDVVEKHFCYDEALRGKVPDGGPWSLSQKDFRKYVAVAHVEGAHGS